MTALPRPRRLRAFAALAFATAVLTMSPPGASADELDDLLRDAGDLPEIERLVALYERLEGLLLRFHRLEESVGRARLSVAEAFLAAERAEAAVDAAQARLDARIRSAYQLGPGASMEAVLGAGSFTELVTFAEFAARAISVDDADLRATIVTRAIAAAMRARAEAEEASLVPRIERLRAILDEMRATIDDATDAAVAAQVEEEARRAFEEEQRQIAEALARVGSWDLGVIDYQQDQSHLLALLGPAGGRTCDTPEGLVATGRGFDGYATWYGWEFGGNPTATGAVFDPTLFTAANRWLPFGTFLRVRHGDRCAIVLVNDRGPYGDLDRVIDLSMAAGQHLGVGVSWIEAEILLPASTLGGGSGDGG